MNKQQAAAKRNHDELAQIREEAITREFERLMNEIKNLKAELFGTRVILALVAVVLLGKVFL